MGVYIDMEMPKNCFDCKLCYDAFYCKVLEIGFYDDRDKEYRQEGFDPETARLQGCPLVSVPPHGRLGDLNSLAERLEDLRKTTAKENPPTDNHGFINGIMCGIGVAINEVRYYTPTIIEAEEEP